MKNLLFTLCLCAGFIMPAFSQAVQQDKVQDADANASSFKPNVMPALNIQPVSGEIVIDGDLSDSGWMSAGVATNFAETFPGDLTKPPIDIEVKVAYDDTYFYVSFHIEDDPEKIRVNMNDRDRIWSDDYVGLMLDINGDAQQSIFIASNPIGIQGDTKQSGGREDISYALIYESEGKVTATGYDVEMAIPFRSLRFPNTDVQKWRVNFWITHPRDTRQTYTWAAIDRDNDCFICQYGYLEGLEGVESSSNLEFLPALTGSHIGGLETNDAGESVWNNNKIEAQPSLTVKYGITSDLIADLTINPDFSQIEADAAQINVNQTFALFFPERRPFFQEGSDLFGSHLQTVYTRTINNPRAATKLTGRIGNTSVAWIGAQDEDSPIVLPFEEGSRTVSAGRSLSNILRIRHGFSDGSYVGLIGSDRRLFEGGSGTTAGVDGRYRISQNYQLNYQYVQSFTQETGSVGDTKYLNQTGTSTFDDGNHTAEFDGESFNGNAIYADFRRNARHWSFRLSTQHLSPTFRADNGFITQNNNRRYSMNQSYTFYFENSSWIDRITPQFDVAYITNAAGERKDMWINPAVFMQLKKQTFLFLAFNVSEELYAGENFSGIYKVMANLNTRPTRNISFGFWTQAGTGIKRFGTPELGNSFDLSMWGSVQPTSRLSISPQISFSKLSSRKDDEDFYSGYVARLRTDYQFTRELFLRVILQYNDFGNTIDIDPLLTYRINPFTAFYIGTSHDFNTENNTQALVDYRQNSRSIFFKFQYLFRM